MWRAARARAGEGRRAGGAGERGEGERAVTSLRPQVLHHFFFERWEHPSTGLSTGLLARARSDRALSLGGFWASGDRRLFEYSARHDERAEARGPHRPGDRVR